MRQLGSGGGLSPNHMAPDSSCHTQYHDFLRQSSSSRQTNASTALLELILISYALLTLASWYLQLTFFRFALAQACLTTIVMFLVWPHGQPRLFHATRSAYAKYKILFVEFCVLVFIMCALLNSLARIRDASTPASNIISVVLRSQPFDLIVKLDVAAVLAIASAHATGHHDVCDRIVRRARWLSRRARDCCVMVWALCLRTLQEIPLEESNLPSGLLRRPSETERRSKRWIRPGPWNKSKFTLSSESTLDRDDIDEMDPSGKLVELRRATTTYEHIHAELRRVGARVRWSTVRYAFNITRNPVNLSLLVNVGANPLAGSPVGQHNHEPGETRQWQPVINLPQRPRASSSSSAYNSPTTLRSMVFQAMDPVNVLKILRMRAQEGQERFEMAEEINRFQEVQQPYLQLPGFINNRSVEALPDTGSSQNLIDANYLSSIDPDLRTMPQSHTGEKSLVAPDGGQIESVGTVKLKWRFKKEPKVYDIAFCIVENCSHRVIIGDGFLTETDTMEAEHSKNRLETRPEPNESADSSSLPSNSKGTQCYRRVVNGRVNGFDHCYASLDTGCEANLMSEECAQWLGLEFRKLPDGHRTVRFADGRWAPLKGQVIIRWSFADDPDQTIELTCYILEKCIQPIIFGVHFVLQQDPFNKHRKAVETVIVDGACDAGVVGLEKYRKFPFGIFGKKKPSKGTCSEIMSSTLTRLVLQIPKRSRNRKTEMRSTIDSKQCSIHNHILL